MSGQLRLLQRLYSKYQYQSNIVPLRFCNVYKNINRTPAACTQKRTSRIAVNTKTNLNPPAKSLSNRSTFRQYPTPLPRARLSDLLNDLTPPSPVTIGAPSVLEQSFWPCYTRSVLVVVIFIVSGFEFNREYNRDQGEGPPYLQQKVIDLWSALWNNTEPKDSEDQITDLANMATTQYLPGRPETLTAAEEQKLKEFWIATYQIFGQPISLPNDAPTESNSTLTRTNSDLSLKKKKKFSFGRNKKESGHNRSESTVSETNGDPDDKYGQTKDFKRALANLSPEELHETFWSFVKYDNPDALLLRFLRARKWDVEKALVMMVSTMQWRGKEVHVEDIMQKGELDAVTSGDEGFIKQLRMGKSFIHGTDKENRPICYVRVKLHKQGDQSEQSLERYTIYLIETTRMMLKSPVDTACVVFDMSGFGLSNMDYAPVKFMIKCFEAHYPESLGICLVHKAPWVFSSIWAIIKGWLDPVVAAKIHFTKTQADITSYIPASNLITELEGSNAWSYSYVEPSLNENSSLQNTAARESIQSERGGIISQYEENTRKWVAGGSPDVKQERLRLTEALRRNYWTLDPYIRAKSWYDRTGVLLPNGDVEFYPEKAAKKEAIHEDLD